MWKFWLPYLVTAFVNKVDADTPNIQSLRDDLNFPGQIGWMNVKYYENSTLDVTPAEIKNVNTADECAAACVTTQYNCESANFKRTEDGFTCEVLEKDKFRYPHQFVTQISTTHLAIQNPCTDEKNCPRDRYMCIPNYSNNTFTCQCKYSTVLPEHDCKCPHDGYDFVTSSLSSGIPYCDCKKGLSPSNNCKTMTICDPMQSQSSREIVNVKIDDNPVFQVWCDEGWATIMERKDGSVRFDLPWDDYKVGFGDVEGEHWLGNDKINWLTTKLGGVQLRITLETNDGAQHVFTYSTFEVDDEQKGYRLRLNGGDCSPEIIGVPRYFCNHSGKEFTTLDVDNDDDSDINCSQMYGDNGGWWYRSCFNVRLTGFYEAPIPDNRISWLKLSNITFARMAISHTP